MRQIIQKRKIWFWLSGLAVVASIFFVIIFGLNLGIDFTGGSLLEVKFTQERPDVQELQNVVSEIITDGDIIIQSLEDKGDIIRFQSTEESLHQALMEKLKEKYPENIQEERYESIGPAIGQELKLKAIYSIILVLIAIVIYVAWAFRKVSYPVKSWKYGVIAIIALIHDITITVGAYAVLGKFMGVEVGLPFVAALLTILGYSVNDTIVVFDRIRENLGRLVKMNFQEVVNRSVNETLSRSINTSLTTVIVLLAIFFFGGLTIKYFVLALIVGIVSGTYSSIFLASPLLVVWENLNNSKN